jgi:poly-gamma-glutamate synthase PgsB/CapB
MPLIPLLAALGLLLGLGALERHARNLAWRAVPIRIHVNGTRGKSTVTRLIWSALREAGIPAVAKTTGTEPRLLLPDGAERPLRRRGPASIREQLQLLRAARRHRARALVVECMALAPDLQWVSEHDMIRGSMVVVTNVRPDHVEIMGTEAASIAGCLSNTIPAGGIVVAGDADAAALLSERAELAGARLVVAEGGEGDWLAENRRTALAVTRALGLSDEVAERGFDSVPHDPGVVRTGTLDAGRWIDATAANDPVSLARLIPAAAGADPVVAVYNHRDDRGPRLRSFLLHGGIVAEAGTLVITGARPAFTLWRQARRQRRGRETVFVPRGRLGRWLADHRAARSLVFCGNTRGIDVSRVLSEAARRG